MNILFVQLPLVDHSRSYVLANLPYAPSTMAAYIKKNFGMGIEIDHLPFVIANFGSNRTVLKYIKAVMPDMVCFSCYLWNVERNIALAREIKCMPGNINIIMGGPEIQPGSWVFSDKRGCVDYFVSGEGEWFFSRLLGGEPLDKYIRYLNGNKLVQQPENELVEAEEIVEPLTNGHMHTMEDGSAFVEMTRGCPYRCAYCFYSKNCSRVRELPMEVLLKAIRSDKNFEINELYILSPTFNTSKDFKKKLVDIAEANGGVRLHTEMRTDGIDRDTARMIYEAGFRSLEVGLQTLTREALARIGRRGSPAREISGMKELQKVGIDLKIGIIPGLPGDSPAGFMKTINKLVRSGFGENIELYPLCMLPGTRIRDEADEGGAVYQKKPPYYFLEGWGFSLDDMKSIISGTDLKTGVSHTATSLPDFTSSAEGILTGGMKLTSDQLMSREGLLYPEAIQTAVFNFYITVTDAGKLIEGLELLFGTIPLENQLYNIILYTGSTIDEKWLMEILLKFDFDCLMRRLHVFDDWRDGLSMKIYQVTENMDSYIRAAEQYGIITPVFRITGENRRQFIARGVESVENMLVADGSFYSVRDILDNLDAGDEMCVGFENEAEQAEYFRMKGQEYVQWPFTLNTIDVRIKS